MQNIAGNTIDKPIILIVDDNDDNLNLAARHLRDANYDVVIANSGPIALEVLEEISPDVILLDVMMPGMDGYEVCTIIKNNPEHESVPIIFLTAKTESEDIVKGFISGGVDYISKPFEKQEFLARVKTHNNLKRSKDTIVVQNKELVKLNQEKDGLLGITAHDLKNPLQGIAGLVDVLGLLLEEIDLPKEQKDSFDQIISTIKIGTGNANQIIMDLLDVNAIEQGDFSLHIEQIDIKHIADEVYNYYLIQAEKKNINLNIHKTAKDCTINTDKIKVERILDNLLSNAIKFSVPESNVWIKISRLVIDVTREIIRIEIKDEGPGISDSDMQILFQKFAKLEARPTAGEPSSRLGLSIVKLLSNAIGADIYCKSKYGEGTTFFLEIPINDN
jgi:two-component system, sensor histidine kinase and response regulator